MISLESSGTAYELRWSEDVLAEWMYRARRKRPDSSDHALGGMRRHLDNAFPSAIVEGYEPSSMPELPDPNDRHVLAAALHGQVDMLVTDDRRAFPESVVGDRLDVYTADEFLTWVVDHHGTLVRPVMQRQMAYYAKNAIVTGGPRDEGQLINALRKAGANTFALRLGSVINERNIPDEAAETLPAD